MYWTRIHVNGDKNCNIFPHLKRWDDVLSWKRRECPSWLKIALERFLGLFLMYVKCSTTCFVKFHLTSYWYYVSQDLKHKENSVKAIQCLNDMITNALIHIEDCLKYLSGIRDPAIFKFCAIPQVFLLPFFSHSGHDMTW